MGANGPPSSQEVIYFYFFRETTTIACGAYALGAFVAEVGADGNAEGPTALAGLGLGLGPRRALVLPADDHRVNHSATRQARHGELNGPFHGVETAELSGLAEGAEVGGISAGAGDGRAARLEVETEEDAVSVDDGEDEDGGAVIHLGCLVHL